MAKRIIMKIFHSTAEFYPFIKAGGLSDMISSLSKEQAKKHQVHVAIPYIRSLLETPKFSGKEFKCIHPNSVIGSESSILLQNSQFLHAIWEGVNLYFFKSSLFENLDRIYENPDEHFRFALFSYACFHLSLELGCDIFHAHDWHAALGTYFHSSSQFQMKTVFTIHNLAYQGDHPEWLCGFLKGEPFYLNLDILKHNGKINYLKGAISVSNKVTTVSPGYRDEVLSEPAGCGLSYNLRSRGEDFVGILNGIDTDIWNPETDKYLVKNYSIHNFIEGKKANKIALYQKISRDINLDRPLVGLIGRLTWQKGYETFLASYRNKWHHPFFYIFLGAGDPHLESELYYQSHHAQERLFFWRGYDEELAHLIEAASDFFLMPSLFEPCGLNQMYSQVYGTIPIVSRVGGLKNTVIEDPYYEENSTGFVFEPGLSHSLDYALDRVNTLYHSKERFYKMQERIMKKDWSWKTRMLEYDKLYENILNRGN